MNTTTTTTDARPILAIYHPNAKGTGGAAKFGLHPATVERDGYISLTLANQRTVGDRNGPTPAFPTFDWDGAIHVELGFADVCEVLRVLCGEVESIDDGKGLYHRTAQWSAVVRLRHMIEPVPGYSLEICRVEHANGAETRAWILFGSGEALGLCYTLKVSMPALAFGMAHE